MGTKTYRSNHGFRLLIAHRHIMHLVLLTEVTHHLIRRVKHLTQVGEEPKMSTIKGKNNEISTRIIALPQCALTQLTSMSVQSHMSFFTWCNGNNMMLSFSLYIQGNRQKRTSQSLSPVLGLPPTIFWQKICTELGV